MYVPPEITTRIDVLSKRIGCELSVVQCWKNEFRPGMYCRFRGMIHDSPVLKIEVAGTLCVELTDDREDEVDTFIFVNGRRVGLYNHDYKYLVGSPNGELRWDNLDEGYDQFDTLDDSYGGRVDDSIVILPPDGEIE